MTGIIRRVIVSAIIEKDGKFLLTQQGDGKHKDYWAFPGGGLEIEDKDLIAAVKREVMEEIGVEIEDEKLLDAQAFIDPGHNIQLVAIFFRCQLKKGEPTISEEIENFKWLTVGEMKALPRDQIRPPVEWFEKLMDLLT